MKLSLSENISKLRKERSMTQEQLAEKLHISISHLAKIEIGRNAPSIDLLLEMAEFFGVTVDELLAERDINKEE